MPRACRPSSGWHQNTFTSPKVITLQWVIANESGQIYNTAPLYLKMSCLGGVGWIIVLSVHRASGWRAQMLTAALTASICPFLLSPLCSDNRVEGTGGALCGEGRPKGSQKNKTAHSPGGQLALLWSWPGVKSLEPTQTQKLILIHDTSGWSLPRRTVSHFLFLSLHSLCLNERIGVLVGSMRWARGFCFATWWRHA